MERLIASRYGQAFFSVALEGNKVTLIKDQVLAVKEALEKDDTLITFLDQPKVKLEDKIATVEKIFKEQIDKDFMGLLVLVIKKARQNFLLDILQVFLEACKAHEKLVVADVTSATELNDEQKAQLIKKLESSLSEKVELNITIDESLLAGFVIRVGDKVMDSSIKGKIDRMTKDLRKIQLT